MSTTNVEESYAESFKLHVTSGTGGTGGSSMVEEVVRDNGGGGGRVGGEKAPNGSVQETKGMKGYARYTCISWENETKPKHPGEGFRVLNEGWNPVGTRTMTTTTTSFL
ncbi:hypothetical protein HZH68_001424 [Vespula germanica]|uniref:Uncharacterized protein n=1 Tax=Vespula germanica TaxID=30212 RepID=A0A834U6U0_VESGE|nr:hypothetical protein HZH68_001424 [Vespula germanica]